MGCSLDWVEELNAQYDEEAHIVVRQRSEGEYDVDPTTGEQRHYALDEIAAITTML